MIETQHALEDLSRELRDCPTIAVDCEMDSMYAYRTSLCVVQVGWGETSDTAEREVLVDAMADLDFSVLSPVFADESIVKVFHGGENDIGLLRAQWGLEFEGVFDTMAAAQVLGQDGVGLAALLDRYFDVSVSKKYQKADWRVRPLPEEQAEYARMDVRYLISLRRRLSAELEHVGRVEEAESEFDRIRRAHYEARPFDPDGWARLKQGRSLEPSARAVLREVFVERDRIAAQLDRAPYRVMHESALVELARRRPRDEEALRKIKGLNRAVVSSHGRALLEAIRRSDGVGPIPMPRRRSRRSPAAGLTPEQSAVFEALRAWRAPRAEERGVDVARVAPSALLETIARAAPTSLDALARVDGMEPWRVREYGEEIVEIVRSSS